MISIPFLRSSSLKARSSPDGMQAQALEHPVETHEYAADSFGLAKTSPALRARLVQRLSEDVAVFIKDELGILSRPTIEQDVLDFYRLLKRNPARQETKGSTQDGLNLWLHLIVRQLQPQIIVESGTLVGRSLYTLKQASTSAEIHSFDISYFKLLFKDNSIEYHEYDFSNSDIKCQGIGFAYFDDHINNGRRIREAYDKGIKYVVFDQCAQVGAVHPYRYPGLPSAIMIADGTLEEGDVIEWIWKEQKLRYQFSTEHTYGAEKLIEFAKPLPSLEDWMGERPGHAVFVKLR